MGTLNTAPVLSLADLEAFDPQGGRGNAREKRWRCPICQADERALCVNMETGAWSCKRASCGKSGKLKDFWQDRPAENQRARVRAALTRAFALDEQRTAPNDENAKEWRGHLRDLRPLTGTPGEFYLSGRGVPLEIADLAGVRFCPSFFGRAAVVFPVRDKGGALVAASGRYLDGRDNPKARTAGPKSEGVCFAPCLVNGQRFGPLDGSVAAIIVTEAPIDALSFAACGFPAIALNGTSGPAWLHLACGLRRVLLAFDADEPGDGATAKLADQLMPYGARCERLRPEGFKDWNEALQVIEAPALADVLAVPVLVGVCEFSACYAELRSTFA